MRLFRSRIGLHPSKVSDELQSGGKWHSDGVENQLSDSGFVSSVGEGGKAARMFRIKPSYFARLTAEPLKSARYCSTVRPRQSSRDMAAKAAEG